MFHTYPRSIAVEIKIEKRVTASARHLRFNIFNKARRRILSVNSSTNRITKPLRRPAPAPAPTTGRPISECRSLNQIYADFVFALKAPVVASSSSCRLRVELKYSSPTRVVCRRGPVKRSTLLPFRDR